MTRDPSRELSRDSLDAHESTLELGDGPVTRRLSTSTPPRPRPLDLAQPTCTSEVSSTEPDPAPRVDPEWTEPEAGFEAISLNDDEDGNDRAPRRRRRSSDHVSVHAATMTTTTTTSSETTNASTMGSTAPTSARTSSSPSRRPSHDEQEQEPSRGSKMADPPDLTKVEHAAAPAAAAGTGSNAATSPTKTRSVMQKIISMTRQRDLPPKNRDEEEKHLRQLADMLAASKEAEKRRRAERETRAAGRAQFLDSVLPTWEQQILPNWRAVLHDDRQGRHLRSLWWQGTMPVRFRGRLWSLCIGNGLAISKNQYALCLQRARDLLEVEGAVDREGTTGAGGGDDEANTRRVEASARRRQELVEFRDAARLEMQHVLPTLKLFQKGGVMHQDLLDLLLAWAVHNTDHDRQRQLPGYPRGLAYPASLLLVNMSAPEAFVALSNLIAKSFLSSFYSTSSSSDSFDAAAAAAAGPQTRSRSRSRSSSESVSSYERVFDTLLADAMPRIYSNFSSTVVRPRVYLEPWLTTCFVGFVPLELATRLFDVWVLEGDSFAFRTSLSLLKILEGKLLSPHFDDLARVFDGSDPGAVAIVKREKGLLTVPGTVHDDEGGPEREPCNDDDDVTDVQGGGGNPNGRVEVEDVYTEMGCTEERVFRVLCDELEWKEETWERLIERELPEAV